MIGLILLVFSFVFAVLAAAGWPQPATRYHLGWVAFAFFVASELFGRGGPYLGIR